jgi:phage baseplate assembly protein W
MALPKISDRFSAQKDTADIQYSDFLTNFNSHPDSKQLALLQNELAVVRSIKNLLSTNKYERLFQPSIGSNLRNFLFEDVSPSTESSIAEQCRNTIQNYEPRAKLIDISTEAYPDQNAYIVSITFYVKSIDNPITVNIPLTRVR